MFFKFPSAESHRPAFKYDFHGETYTHTAHTCTCTHTQRQTHRTMKNEKGRERYELKSNVLPGLLLLLSNFHADGKTENVSKILFFHT